MSRPVEVDPNLFCREATLKICSTFEVEQSLKHCFDMLAEHMPVDVIYLTQYQEDQLALRFIASARRDSCSSMDTLVRLPEIDEKKAAGQAINDALGAIGDGHVVFGRNESGNQHLHDTIRSFTKQRTTSSSPVIVSQSSGF